jgi:hypothetical protein
MELVCEVSMKRLLRISLDTLLMSTLPIIMWMLLGIAIDKNIANVFTLTYPIQFLIATIVAIFGIGPNINATKNNKKDLINTNIVIGTIISLIIISVLVFNVDTYIKFMNMDVKTYKIFCIYSFIFQCLQLVLQLICHKLYYLNQHKKSNKLTLIFNITNIIFIILLSLIFKDQKIATTITLIIDTIIIIIILYKNLEPFTFKVELFKNSKYALNDIVDYFSMFVIYLIGYRNSFAFGVIYIVAINFETLIMDAQWDMSYAIETAASIDSSTNKLNYKKSLKNAYKLVGLLLLSSLIVGLILYNYYDPNPQVLFILLGVQVINMFLMPTIWIKQQYCLINYSSKIAFFHQIIAFLIGVVASFINSPYCTYIGQLAIVLYQALIFNVIYHKKYKLKDGYLTMQ